MWMLRRMKILNIQTEIVLAFYFKKSRSILEMGCQVFHSGKKQAGLQRDRYRGTSGTRKV